MHTHRVQSQTAGELWLNSAGTVCMSSVRGDSTVYEEPPVGGQVPHHGTNNVPQADRQGVNILTPWRSCREASRNV